MTRLLSLAVVAPRSTEKMSYNEGRIGGHIAAFNNRSKQLLTGVQFPTCGENPQFISLVA
jgi:hypothetical protein